MRLFKDGKEALVDKSQLKVLLDAGWTMESEEVTEDIAEDLSEDNELEEVKVTAKPKKTRKPKKISI